MAESSGVRELDVAALISRLEGDSDSPDKRAQKVLAVLINSDLSDYDAVCFSIEFLALMAASMPWLADEIKPLVRKLYIMHTAKFKDIEWLSTSPLGSKKGNTL